MEYHTEYSILCSEGHQVVSCVKMERWNCISTQLTNPNKLLHLLPMKASYLVQYSLKLIRI